MTVSIKESIRTARLQVLIDAIDAAATPGQLLLYPGTRAAPGAATIEPLQAAVTLAQPCAEVLAAVAIFVAGVEGLRLDDETITWGRFVDGDGSFVMDADVSLVGDGGDVEIDNTGGVVGAFVRVEVGFIGE